MVFCIIPIVDPEAPDISDSVRGLPDHSGQQAPFVFDFFALPSAEIGMLLSAESTVGWGQGPWPIAVRLIKSALAAVAGFLVVFFVSIVRNAIQDGPPSPNLLVTCLCGSVAVFTIVYFATRTKAICSFVGTQGVELYTRSGRRSFPYVGQLLFADAKSLSVSKTDHYLNGIYNGTSYNYRWSNADKQIIFTLRGRHRGRGKLPRQGDFFHFTRSAQIAWNQANQAGWSQGYCPKCNYNLTGNETGICPECGTPILQATASR